MRIRGLYAFFYRRIKKKDRKYNLIVNITNKIIFWKITLYFSNNTKIAVLSQILYKYIMEIIFRISIVKIYIGMSFNYIEI